jgi:hypothetical protein
VVIPKKGSGYFYFFGGEATDWIDRTGQAATVNGLTLEEWIAEFKRLKKVNAAIMASGTEKARAVSYQETP